MWTVVRRRGSGVDDSKIVLVIKVHGIKTARLGGQGLREDLECLDESGGVSKAAKHVKCRVERSGGEWQDGLTIRGWDGAVQVIQIDAISHFHDLGEHVLVGSLLQYAYGEVEHDRRQGYV